MNTNHQINLQIDNKTKRSKSQYNTSNSLNTSQTFPSTVVVFKVKNEKKDEDYWIAKNYIKMLRQSEFYMI